jgi:NAD(P)-dependent dehydrogenase (short-subunit alcohol dehydrogenase family)
MKKKKKIKDKIIVTGSEGLIGKSLVKQLSKSFNLVKVDLKLGHDLTDEKKVIKIINSNKDSVGLVNLFSINPQPNDLKQDLFSISIESLRSYLEINTIALFSVCRAYAKVCPNKSSIINFSSIYGVNSPKHFVYEKGFTKHIGYTISKSSVIGMTKYLATYLAPKIRVNTIVPGGIQNNQKKEFISKYSSQVPMKRMMKRDELLGAVEYLLSPKSSYVTGSTVFIDGGWTAW